MSEILAEGSIIEVRMRIRLPAAADEDHIQDWLNFELGRSGGLSMDNPLSRHDPESWGLNGLEWEATGFVGRREESDRVEHDDGRITYRVFYRETPA